MIQAEALLQELRQDRDCYLLQARWARHEVDIRRQKLWESYELLWFVRWSGGNRTAAAANAKLEVSGDSFIW